MPTTFYSPRNPMLALWASSVERTVQKIHPELSIQDVRRTPMMQGAYRHLRDLKTGKRQARPAAGAGQIEIMAFLSQEFLDLAVTTVAFNLKGYAYYAAYLALLEKHNDDPDNNIADFSTDDTMGFALCLIVWVGMAGQNFRSKLSSEENDCVDYLMDQIKSKLTQQQIDSLRSFWSVEEQQHFTMQYRDAKSYPGYGAIPWTLPTNWQVVMLGDWGTGLDDAHEFLYAIWKKAFLSNPHNYIVFIHLGDIYYCGLPYECDFYFYQIFKNAGLVLAQDADILAAQRSSGVTFNQYPPIFTIPGNHEYYSDGYGYFELLDSLNQNVPGVSHAQVYQQCSFFCLRDAANQWQFLGMDTGQADGNGLLSALQAAGGAVEDWVNNHLPSWGWVEWIEGLSEDAYSDVVGPFQPTLRANEVTWLQDKLTGFQGKTVFCSHHQLFSRQATLNNDNPKYLNTFLLDTFGTSFKTKVAAWYWGHEHTFAVYLDGLNGLNKGRLLGSSSYEATEDGDSPYADDYPMVPFATCMKPNPIMKNSDGLYYHAGAIFVGNGGDISVKYYQFAAWSQLDDTPTDLTLLEITTAAETISYDYKTLTPYWIGNTAVIQNKVTTDSSPSITNWGNVLYMLYMDGNNSVKLASADTFVPTTTSSSPSWVDNGAISIGGKGLSAHNSPAIIAVNGILYGFYVTNGGNIQVITKEATQASSWVLGRLIPSGSGNLAVGDASPAVCFFNGSIYLVYRVAKSPNALGWASYEIAIDSWTDWGAMLGSDTHQTPLLSERTPAIAADEHRMVMTFKKSGNSTDIQWAESSGGLWTVHGDIETTDKDKSLTNPDTNIGLTLCYSGGMYYMIYTAGNDHLKLCVLDYEKSAWYGDSSIKAGTSSTGLTNCQSITAPSLTIVGGGGYLVYRNDVHDEIYWAYF